MDNSPLEEVAPIPTAKSLWTPPKLPFVAACNKDNNPSFGIVGSQGVKQFTSLEELYQYQTAATRPSLRRTTSQRITTREKESCLSEVARSQPKLFNPWASRLSRNQIRLFALEMGDDEDVFGILVTFDRDDAPKYSALSYVCGEGPCEKEVYVNGGCLCVKPNLLAALEQVKSSESVKRHGEQILWIWVDAISINQEDATEKAEQIQEMYQVYRRANSVLACLGGISSDFECLHDVCWWLFYVSPSNPSFEYDQSRLGLEERLRSSYGFDKRHLRFLCELLEYPPPFGETDDISEHFDRDEIPIPFEHRLWQSCTDVIDHAWFSRLWTYQEFRLATHALVLLGNHIIHWRVLSPIFGPALYRNKLGTILAATAVLRTDAAYRLGQDLIFQHSDNSPKHLWSLLGISCQRKAALPKDHVFALVGLLTPEIRKSVVLEYSRSDASVFANALEIAISQEGSALELPRYWESVSAIYPTTTGLPSWCPDMVNAQQVRVRWRHHNDSVLTLSEPASVAYTEFASVCVNPSEKCLHMKVMIADTVEEIVETPCPPFEPQRFSGKWKGPPFRVCLRHWFLRLHSTLDGLQAEAVMPKTEAGLEFLFWSHVCRRNGSLLQTILELAGREDANGCVRSSLRAHLANPTWCLSNILSYCHINNESSAQACRQGPQSGALCSDECSICGTLGTMQPGERSDAVFFLCNIAETIPFEMAGMFVFRTTAGRYGQSLRRPSPGDNISVVPGGRLLHIISADKSRYVGAASVYGLMDDDLLDLFPEPEKRFEESCFVLIESRSKWCILRVLYGCHVSSVKAILSSDPCVS